MIRQTVQNSHFLSIYSSDTPCGSIIYIHGLGESGLCFGKLIENKRLSDWNHIVPDLSGYGRSIWPRQGVDLRHHAEMVAEIARKPIRHPLILIGHSMGGVIGQIVCEKYPELIDAFFNVEGNISFQDCTFSSRAAKHKLEKFAGSAFEDLKKWVYLAGVKNRADVNAEDSNGWTPLRWAESKGHAQTVALLKDAGAR